MRFRQVTPPEPNPAFDSKHEILQNMFTVDDHIRKQNGHKLPIEMQLLLEPMWTIRSRFADACIPLQNVTTRYMKIRHVMIEIDESIVSGTVSPSDCKFVFEEIEKLYEAYGEYAKKLKGVQRDLQAHLNFYNDCGDRIWDCMNRLAIIDQQACKIRAYCLKISMIEYGNLEEQINESMQNCLHILRCSVSYLAGIINHLPESSGPNAEESELDGGNEPHFTSLPHPGTRHHSFSHYQSG